MYYFSSVTQLWQKAELLFSSYRIPQYICHESLLESQALQTVVENVEVCSFCWTGALLIHCMHATFLWHFYSFSCSFQGGPRFTSQLSTFDKHNLRNPLREAVIRESNQEAHAVLPAPWLSFLGDLVKSCSACVSLPAKHSDKHLPFEHHLLWKWRLKW